MGDQMSPLERLRDLVDGMTSAEIVAHVVPYYHGWQVEGEWLDKWREDVGAELDKLEDKLRLAGVWCAGYEERGV